jgi:hypothetical protein
MINFAKSEPKIVAMWSEPLQFRMLAPAGGWRAGATTDKRNDFGRDYAFDVEGSAHSRTEWVESIRRHIEHARLHGDGSESSCSSTEAGSEYWEDGTVDEQSAQMARIFARRALVSKESRQ